MLEKANYQWYAIYTRANAEKKLYDNLQEMNIECYLPMKKTLKVWSDRKKWVEEPMFRCYIFVKVSFKEFFTVLNTPGFVCHIFGGKDQSIPEIQIDGIRSFLAQSDHDVTLSYERIQKGVNVVVQYGSLKGIIGEFINVYGQNRLVIRIDSMICSLQANISREEVKLLEDKSVQHEYQFS